MQRNALTPAQKHTIKIKSVVQKIKDLKTSEKEQGWNSYQINIIFNKDKFNRKFDLFQEWFDYMTNSKVGLFGAKKTNRELWKDLNPIGYIKFLYGHEEIHLDFILITQKNLNFLDFNLRIRKCLVPDFYAVTHVDLDQIVGKFDDEFLKCLPIKVFSGSNKLN